MKVSIITCTYNSAATVADTIRSVNRQTYDNIEHIIVDGLSKDDTVAVVKANAGNRQRIIEGKDKGIYDAFNKGILAATGDIVGVLNSDDFFTDDYVIEMVVKAFLLHPEIDAVYGDIHFVNPDNLTKPVRYYSSRIFRRGLMRMGFMPAHPSFYVRKSCYDKLGIYKIDYKIAADFELLLRFIFLNRIRIHYLPIDFVTMRTGGASTESMESRKLIMKEQLRACRENNVYTNLFILSLRYWYKVAELIFSKLLFKLSQKQ